MTKKRDRIFIKDWLILKPYLTESHTDLYYLRVCNEIKSAFSNSDYEFLYRYLDDEDINLLCCFLTSYFEDIISETNIWNTFVDYHQDLYGKPLPFYYPKDYFYGEINPEDIAFLLWYFINIIQNKIFVSPYHNELLNIAEITFDIFDREYEFAPENEKLKDSYLLKPHDPDDEFYAVREIIDNCFFNSYLFYPDTRHYLIASEMELFEEHNEDDLFFLLSNNREHLLYSLRTRLLNLRSTEWSAGIFGDRYAIKNDLLKMPPRVHGFFLYKGAKFSDILLEHIASGKLFKVTRKSIEEDKAFKADDTILLIGLVRWKNEWWFSGSYYSLAFNSDLILDEKNSIESRRVVNFLDQDEQAVTDFLKKQESAFLQFNNGEPIAFMPAGEIEPFMQNFLDFFNKSILPSQKEREKALKRAREDGILNHGRISGQSIEESTETGLVFFNHEHGIEVAIGINSAFPLKNNPYFNIDQSDQAVAALLMSDEFSKGLAMYCIEHCRKDLPFFQKENRDPEMLRDMDFLLRFWKRESYHVSPEVSLIGKPT